MRSGWTSSSLVTPPWADGEAGLHLVEGEQGVVLVEQVFQAGEVAGLGLDDPGVHHDRLDDHARDLVFVGFQEPGHAVHVVERGDQGQVGDGFRDAGGGRRAVRRGGWTCLFRFRGDGDLNGVVVAVVAALDLDDQVAAGDGAHQVDGIHGGLGAGVGEPPAGQAEAAGEFAGHRDGGRGRLRELSALGDLRGDGLLDGRVSVAGQGGAVAAVQVHVLVAVDVVDLRAVAVAQPDRLRRGDLPARGDTTRQVLLGGLGEVRGVRLAADEDLFLGRDDLLEGGVSEGAAGALGPVGAELDGLFGGVVDGHHGFPGLLVLTERSV